MSPFICTRIRGMVGAEVDVRFLTNLLRSAPFLADRKTGVILAVGLLFTLAIMLRIPYTERTHDLGGHLDYITHLTNYGFPPLAHVGWEGFQPPLYYYLSLPLLLPYQVLGGKGFAPVQWLSLACYAGFIFYSCAAMWRALGPRPMYYIVLAALVLWLNNAMMGSRINNDILYYFLYAAAFYHFIVWYEEPQAGRLAKAIILGGLSLAAKSSGLILCATMTLLAVYRMGQQRSLFKSLLTREVLIASAIALALAMTNFGRLIYAHVAHGMPLILVPNMPYLNEGLLLKHGVQYVAGMDMKLLLQPPFYNSFVDISGRQYYWIGLIKTALFGEYAWKLPYVAGIMNLLLLTMGTYTLLSLLTMRGADAVTSRRLLLFAAGAFLPMLMLMIGSRVAPEKAYACAQHFRYINPALTYFLIIYALVVERNRSLQHRVLYAAGLILPVTLTVSGVILTAAQLL